MIYLKRDIDREKNSALLTSRLEQFTRDYPAFYKLIGFQEDSPGS